MPPEAPPDGTEEIVLESLPSPLTPRAPGNACTRGDWRRVLLATAIAHCGEKQKGRCPADGGGHVFQYIPHPQVSSLPSDVPRRLKTSR